MPTTPSWRRPEATRGGADNSARQAAADSRSNRELHTGTTTASADMTTRANSNPCMPPGVSSTTWVTPGGAFNTFFWSRAQGEMAGRDAERRLSQALVLCWRSTSPSMTATPSCASHAAKCVAKVLFPLPPLRLTIAITGMLLRVVTKEAQSLEQKVPKVQMVTAWAAINLLAKALGTRAG